MNLQHYRNEIDEIDTELTALINKRAAIARSIGAIKASAGLPVTDHEREADVLRRVVNANTGSIADESLARIFTSILRESRQIQIELNAAVSNRAVVAE